MRDNLPKIKDGEYIINVDGYEQKETHWIALYVNGDNDATYVDSFAVERIPKKNLKVYRSQKYQKKHLCSTSI